MADGPPAMADGWLGDGRLAKAGLHAAPVKPDVFRIATISQPTGYRYPAGSLLRTATMQSSYCLCLYVCLAMFNDCELREGKYVLFGFLFERGLVWMEKQAV